jgi:hypothetical protein
MTEIKINIELGLNAELKEFVTALLPGTIRTGAMPRIATDKTVAAHTTKSRQRKIEETAQTAQPLPEKHTEQKTAITLPDLRTAVKRLYDGGKHKEELPAIFGQFGAKNVTEVAEDKYQELYDTLTKKSEELGL